MDEGDRPKRQRKLPTRFLAESPSAKKRNAAARAGSVAPVLERACTSLTKSGTGDLGKLQVDQAQSGQLSAFLYGEHKCGSWLAVNLGGSGAATTPMPEVLVALGNASGTRLQVSDACVTKSLPLFAGRGEPRTSVTALTAAANVRRVRTSRQQSHLMPQGPKSAAVQKVLGKPGRPRKHALPLSVSNTLPELHQSGPHETMAAAASSQAPPTLSFTQTSPFFPSYIPQSMPQYMQPPHMLHDACQQLGLSAHPAFFPVPSAAPTNIQILARLEALHRSVTNSAVGSLQFRGSLNTQASAELMQAARRASSSAEGPPTGTPIDCQNAVSAAGALNGCAVAPLRKAAGIKTGNVPTHKGGDAAAVCDGDSKLPPDSPLSGDSALTDAAEILLSLASCA